MNPQHREFFIKLRALCDEYDVKIEVSEDEAVLLFVFGPGTGELEFYKTFRIARGSSIHLSWTVVESLHPSDEEPQP